MNPKLMTELFPEIQRIASCIVKDKYFCDELTQDMVLACYDSPKFNSIQKTGNLSGWLYIVGRNLHAQRSKGITYVRIEGELIEENEPTEYPNVKKFEEMLLTLTERERLWIQAYVESGFKTIEIQRRTKISRQFASKRLKQIFEKWKHLDIYLPSQP